MPVRVRYKIEVAVSSTTAEERDLGNAKYEVVVDSQNEGGTWKTLLAAASTDVQLYLPNIATARFIMLRTSAKDPLATPVAISVKRNSTGGEAIAIAPMSGAKEGHMLLSTTSLTALYATNAGTVDMEIVVVAAGD